MSNEYKDWFDDRAHEAWEDLTKIAELWEEWEKASNSSFDFYYEVEILDLGEDTDMFIGLLKYESQMKLDEYYHYTLENKKDTKIIF